MADICLYFHVHQPQRLKRFSLIREQAPARLGGGGFDFGGEYFDEGMNRHYFEKAARQCYLPANKILLKLCEENGALGRKFKFSFSVTGVFLEQAQKFDKRVLESFQQLASTGGVEFLGETYYHSLAGLYADKSEFREQVEMHSGVVRDLFGQAPKSFRNTELIFNNSIAKEVEGMGFGAILSEGIEWVLGWRSPNYAYRPKGCKKLKVLLRNYKLSDDVGYRFSAKWWSGWPLTADKYASWLSESPGQMVNLFMDFETFGEHHWQDTGILNFLQALPEECFKRGNLQFKTVGEAAESHEAVDEIDVQGNLSWADLERDVSAWLGNKMQNACFGELQSMAPEVKQCGDGGFLHAWRKLQTSDHLMYLCTKSWADGDVHKYFSPYKENSPYDNFINFMNIIQDFKSRIPNSPQCGAGQDFSAQNQANNAEKMIAGNISGGCLTI